MKEIHIFISGNVQGVGFRAAVQRHALLYQIHGYAKNLPDGRVEICAQGSEIQIENFIHTLEQRPGSGSISHLEKQYGPIRFFFDTFEIR